MNSFRVVDTKFRILKGGKIGLSLSIALIGGILLSTTKAGAETFFDGTTDGTIYSSGISAQEKSDDGDITATYNTVSSSESIVFKPERVVSSYTGVSDYEISGTSPNQSSVFQASDGITTGAYNNLANGTYTYSGLDAYGDPTTFSGTNYDRAYYQTFTPSTIFTITLDSNAQAYNIYKDSSTYYRVNSTNGYATNSDAYTANLIFTGSNTISGYTDIDAGNIKLNGTTTFAGTVEAGSIDVDTTDTITFNSAVDLSSGTTDTMKISTNGNIILNSDLTGNVTTTANNQGILTTTGNSQTITGNIGTSTSLDLSTLNIGSATVPTNYSSTTISGDVFASSTVLNNNGTTNSSTLILSNGSDITSTITTADSNMGILTLSGSSTITGAVGTNTDKLAQVNSGTNGSSSTITDNVYAVNVTNTGTGTTTFKNDLTATNLNVNAGTTNIEDNLTATTTTITTGTGNFNTISGNTISDIVFSGSGTANFSGNLAGNITTTGNNQGTVTIVGESSGKVQTITGNVGTSTSLDLSILNIGSATVASNYSTTIINGNVYANSTVLNNGTTASSELKLASGKNITSTITTADDGKGILTLVGGTQTVTGSIGTTGVKLAEVNTGNGNSTFSSDVFATNLDVEGTGSVNLNGDFTGTNLRYNADGSVNLADNKNVNSAIITASNNTGTLNLLGTSTVSGQVGTLTNKLKEINTGITAETGSFSSDVFATNLDVEGTGSVNLNGDFTGTNLRYNADGSVNLADNKNVNSAIITASNNTGTLNLLGTSTVSGQVGTLTNKLKEINTGITAETGSFSSDVFATNLDVEGTGSVNLNGDFTGTNLRYNADGSVNLADNKNVNSAIITASNNTGTLNLLGTSTVSGQVGDSINKLKEINTGITAETGSFSSDVFATNLDVEGTGSVNLNGDFTGTNLRYNADGSVNLADNKNVNSAIITASNNTGTLNLLGTSTVSGQVGTLTNKLKEINTGITAEIGSFSSDVFATNLDVEGTGSVNLNGDFTGTNLRYNADGSVNLADNKNVNSAIITASNNTGTLNLLGTSTVSGQVGTLTNKLKEINSGITAEIGSFSSDVFATNLDVEGTGSVNLNGDFTGTNLRYNADGSVNLADNKNVNSAIITASNNTGTLNLLGTSTVSGQVGTLTNKLKEINTGITAETGSFSSDVFATNLDVEGTGSVNLNGDFTGTNLRYNADGSVNLADNKNVNSAIITASNNTGTLNLLGTSTVSGQVGTLTNKLKEINTGITAEIGSFSSDVFATNLDVEGTGSVNLNGDFTGTNLRYNADGSVNLADNKNVNSAIITASNNTGTLNLLGTSTVSGQVGTLTNKLKEINTGITAEIGSFSSDVFATNLDVEGTGSVNLNGDFTGTNLRYNADGSVNLADNKNVNSAIITASNNTGTLNLLGTSTVSGQVGTLTNKLKEINTGITAETGSFSSDVFATNLDVEGTGSVNLNGDFTGTNLRYNADGSVNLADNKNVNSAIITASNNTGTLNLLGTSTVSGQVGTLTNKLKEINTGITAETGSFSSDVFATNLDVEGTGSVNLNGDFTGTNLRYNADGSVNLADNKNVNSAIITASNNTGTLNLLGTSTVSGQVGTLTNKLKEINTGITAETGSFSSDVFATNLDVEGTGSVNLNGDFTGTNLRYNADGSVNLADNKNVNSAIITASNNTGTLNLLGTSTVSGQVGTLTNKLKEINTGITAETGSFSSDVFATNLDVEGTGSVNLNGDFTGTNLRYNADGSVNLADNKNVNSAIITASNNTGTLNLLGTSTVSGQVGTLTNKLKEINTGITAETGSFSSDVFATNLDVEGTGSVNLNGDFTGTNLRYNADGSVNLADNKNVNSAIITASNNTGTLNLLGTSTVSGQVGTLTNKLKEINTGITAETGSFSSDVFATNLDVEGTGSVNLNGDFTGTNLRYNADGSVNLADNKNVNSAIITASNNTGTLNLLGTSTVSGQVGTLTNKLKEINTGITAETGSFSSDVFATNLDVEGTGSVNLNGDFTGTNLRYNADGSVNLADNKNVNSAIITASNNTGTLNLLGTSTVSGQVGTLTNKLKEINTGITAETGSFSSDVFATNLDVEGTGSVNLNGDFTGTNLRYNADGSVNLADNKNVNSAIITASNNTGTLNLLGTSTVSGQVGTLTNKLKEINTGITAETGSFSSDVFATNLDVEGIGSVNLNGDFTGTNLRYNADGSVNLADNKNVNSAIITASNNTGTLNLLGTSTVSGQVGTLTNKLKEINTGSNDSSSTFTNDVYATDITNTGTGTTTFKDNLLTNNLNVNAGMTNVEDNLTATTTTISTGTANLNTASGTTSSNIVFNNIGTANLNGDLTGDIKFAGNNATVNVSDGKGILGSVQTLASNNTGILNYKGDGFLDGTIGSNIYGIKELNVNTNNQQNKDSNGVVLSQGLFITRELFADVIGLKNNATLTLADNANIKNTGSDNLVITTDAQNSGKLVFEGSSEVSGEVGSSGNNLSNITAGASNETVVFNDMVNALNLFYSGNGTVELKGDNSSNQSSEGIIGTVDLNASNGTLKIGDDVSITTGISGTQFANANNAILTFDGNSTVSGILGGNTAGNSTFEKINAGADGKIVTFKNDVYVKESNDTTFHVSGTGTVNFEGNLIGDLVFDNDGTVNIANSKSVIVSTIPLAIRSENDYFGTLNFEGNTTLYTDIGTSSKKLKNVTFGSEGSGLNTYTQDINKNIYAQNSYIGNGSNKTSVNITKDITFGGNLDLRNNSSLNVGDFDVKVVDDLTIANNTALSFKVYTTDISAGTAVENPRSGSITANTFAMANDTKININYDGSWYGAGKYNLINATNATTDYYGTELNGLVSDNSIIDSIIKKDGNNLTLFADRTGGNAYSPEDLYIVKSEVGKDYSNAASKSLAAYANEAQRENALTDIIRKMEELDGGLVVNEAKKDEMVTMQRLLTPIANSSNIQSSLNTSNLALKTIGGRLSDVRAVQSKNFVLKDNEILGLSSGDYTLDNTLWLRAIGSKTNQKDVENYTGFDTSTYGFVGGIDKTLKNNSTFGLAFAYSNTQTDQNNAALDSSDTKSLQATIYSSKEIGNAYIDGYLSYAKHSTDGIRTANSGKLAYDVDADQISAKIESGYKFKLDRNTSLTPFGSLEYNFINQKDYKEEGTSYQNDALIVDSLQLNRGTVEVGAKLKTDIQFKKALISPQLSASVYSSFGDNKSDIKAQFIGGGDKFVTPVQELNKTMYNVGLGLETKLSENTSLNLDIDYDRSTNSDFEGYSGSLTFGVKF